MQKAGVVPKERFDLSALEIVMPAGSPVSPAITKWFYDDVKADLWIATGSGGTDCCTGFVGGVPTLPVRAGEIQARSLGVAAAAWDDAGHPVVGQVGELVITEPMPSMPLFFWGDEDGARYRASYFESFPGVWRHGDFFELNERGGCFVRGRSGPRPQPAGGPPRRRRALPGRREPPRRGQRSRGQPRPTRREVLHA